MLIIILKFGAIVFYFLQIGLCITLLNLIEYLSLDLFIKFNIWVYIRGNDLFLCFSCILHENCKYRANLQKMGGTKVTSIKLGLYLYSIPIFNFNINQ